MFDEHYGQVFIQTGPVTRIQWLICAFTQSPAFHAGIGIGNGLVISANPAGVLIESEDLYASTAIWSRFPLTDLQKDNAVEWALAREGRPYNWINDALIGLENMTPLRFPRWISRHWDDDDSYQCAQLADAALTHGAGFQVFNDGRTPGRVSPGSFAELFKARGWWPDGYWAPHASLTSK